MKIYITLVLFTLFSLLTACASNSPVNTEFEDNANPYHWIQTKSPDGLSHFKKELKGTPGSVLTDPQLNNAISTGIEKLEKQSGFYTKPIIIEKRNLQNTNNLIQEAWAVSRGNKSVAYVITLKPSKTSQASITFTGPWK